MKKISNFLCTLAPWFFFWGGKALNLPGWGLAAAIASMGALCGCGWHRMKAPDWTQVIFFSLVLAGIGLAPLAWAVQYQGLLAPGLFLAMSLGSLLIGHPFTVQYAREEVPANFWEDPGFPLHFFRVNRILTCLWTLVFAIGLACAWAGGNHVLDLAWIFQALPVAAFLLATALTRFFPLWYQKNFYEPSAARPKMA